MFMANVHIAHDSVVGDNVIMANNSVIGGHVRIGDGAIVGGNSAVHQFCRIGRKAMIGGMTGVERDVVPFAIVTGDRGRLRGLNVVGLKRGGYTPEVIKSVTHGFTYIFKGKDATFDERLKLARDKFKDNDMVIEQLDFIDEALAGRRKVMIVD